ncbi:Carbon starvation protein CstA [Bacteroidales bacterium WCE2004]|nr:Carbon starvation protein CstA [Bacteroidales bacterium WCE2004]
MVSFFISVLALILGFLLYGRFVERVFGPDPARPTPAVTKADGIDYIALPSWKVFMIQFLNIAGTGPIFGAIMGAKFGPAAYLWIVFGCIFGGAVHDYLSGMLSLRNGGAGLPELIGKYLGKSAKTVMLCFSILLLVLVGAVFVYSPAVILKDLAGDGTNTAFMVWAGVIFVYYIIATMLPIDKIIGRIYPFFAVALIFMAVALLVGLIVKMPQIPELWDGLQNRTQTWGGQGQPIWPYMFVTIACGAISGFHATQSPLMARCLKNEKLGRPVFYGSMITEGLVALIWAAVSSYFFFGGGAAEVGGSFADAAPTVVTKVSRSWLGIAGSILALVGVVAAPITSGDTALRSARLIIADFLHFDQKPVGKRLAISIPLFLVAALMLWFNIANEDGFNVIWRYFGWANQTLAVFTLWALTVFLARERKGAYYLMTLLPACIMTAVSVTYISIAQIGFNLPMGWNRWIGAAVIVLGATLFFCWKGRQTRK